MNNQILINLLQKYEKSASKKNITYNHFISEKKIIIVFDYEPNDEDNFDTIGIKITFEFAKNSVKITPKKEKIASQHLLNLVCKKMKNSLKLQNDDKFQQEFAKIYEENDIKNAFVYCLKFIPELKSFCVVSGKKLGYKSNKFTFCEDIDAQYIIDELPVGEYVVNSAHSYPELTKFILSSGIAAIKSNRRDKIFEPFPNKFILYGKNIKRGELSALNNEEINKDFGMIDALLADYNVNTLFDKIMNCSNDEELCDKLGFDLFYLVRFIIMSNKTDVKNVDLFEGKLGMKNQQYQVVNKPEAEAKFKEICDGDSCYLFHGSGYENWYSILRNGLKIMSGTKLMTSGAAYGTGIYLSDSFQFSYNYSSRNCSDTIVAVFEVKGNKELYKKSHNIYVVQDDTLLLLRYLLVFGENGYSYNELISRKFGVEMIKETPSKRAERDNTIPQMCAKRLTREISLLKSQENLGFTFDIDEANMKVWKVYLSDFPESELANDMKKYNIDNIELEISFPNEYPMHAPFVRVIRPRFIRQTGHITFGGSICLDFLTKESYSPATKLESIIITIKSLLTSGDGRIDPQKLGDFYSESEAKQAFRAIAANHGWKIFS